MAKIRVEQIKDLSLATVAGVQTITIGASDSIKPLVTNLAATAPEDTPSVISNLAVEGNQLKPTYTSIASILNGYATETYVTNAINALDVPAQTLASVTDGVVTLSTTITETDGKIAVSGTTTLHKIATSGAAADVAVATGIDGLEATDVQAALEELAGDIATLNAAQLGAGNGIDISTDHKVSVKVAENENVLSVDAGGLKTTLGLNWNATTTEIELVGIDGEVIDSIDAKDFVVDGMLSDAEVITATAEDQTADANVVVGDKYIKLTFITKYHDENGATVDGEKVVYVAAKSLVDVYTADEVYLTVSNNKFSHKTSGVTAGQYGADDAASVTTFGGTATINVPSVTVDAAGHVTAAEDKTLTVSIPALPTIIDTAVQNVTGDTYVGATKAGTEVTLATVTGDVAAGENKLATAASVKAYVDSKVSGATTEATETLEFSKLVKGTKNDAGAVTLAPGDGYTVEAGSVCVYINGQLIPSTGYLVSGNTVTVNAAQYDTDGSAFTVISTDRIDVVAHATKTVTLTYLKLAATQA